MRDVIYELSRKTNPIAEENIWKGPVVVASYSPDQLLIPATHLNYQVCYTSGDLNNRHVDLDNGRVDLK